MKNNAPSYHIIEINQLKKSFGNNHVLNGFSMVLNEGESLVIMGKSGSGKSVMVKCLIGLMQPDEGYVKIMNQPISTLKQNELDNLRTKIGFLFQGSALYDSMTVKENLEFPLRRTKLSDSEKQKMVMEALESVKLPQTLHLMPEELSGGMKRRIALARAIILKPKIIIYDEPTTGLDPITSKEIVHLMKEIQLKNGSSSLIITHDVDCARVIADRMILLVNGINYTEGTFKELSSSTNKTIQAFFK